MSTRNLFELEGKVAVITGSSKGIGLAIARGLAEFGAKVVLSSRDQNAVDIAAKEFKKDGYTALAQSCHVGDEDQRKYLAVSYTHLTLPTKA